MKKTFINMIAVTVALCAAAQAEETKPPSPMADAATPRVSGTLASPPARNLPVPAKAKWFTDARLGTFICWSPVSIRNQEFGWSWNAGLPAEEYKKICREFNPRNFDADAWVKVISAGGFKYVVLVTKHHDGYCLWDTKQTDFGTMHAPFGKDVCKELAAACRKYGVEFCTYYSIGDIHQNGWDRMYPVEENPPPVKGGMDAYMEFMKKQCGELMAEYGTRNLFFDGFWHKEWCDQPKYRKALAAHLRAINPDVLLSRLTISNSYRRRGASADGWNLENNIDDYQSREEIGDDSYVSLYYEGLWEYCTSPTYPLYSYAENMKYRTSTDCIRQMVMIAGRNGNYLYNFSPRPDGSVDPKQAELLKEMGAWLKIHGESIYGTEGGPYLPVKDSFVCTRKGDKVYLHLLNRQAEIKVPVLSRKFTGARLLKNGKPLRLAADDGVCTVTIPEGDRDACDTVVVLEADGPVADERLRSI